MTLDSVKMKNGKSGLRHVGRKGDKYPHFMKVGVLVAEENVNKQTDKQTRFMYISTCIDKFPF